MTKKKISGRKHRTRPPTIGRDCKYLKYENGQPVCMRKIKINEYRDDIKYGCVPAFDDVSCSKSKNCWYEPNDSATVSKLNKMIKKKD